ncbi:MAG TPA: hypothetical protein VGL81_14045 [Polyangiaceae bacterium]
MDTQRILAKPMKVVRILWAALTFSNVLIGVVTCFMPPPRGQVLQSQQLVMLSVFALAAAVASFIVPMRARAQALARVRVELLAGDGPPVPDRPAGRFANPQDAARKAMANAFTPFIMSMALSEAVSLVGLSLHAVGGPLPLALGFVAAGTVLAASRFPTPARLLAPFERAKGATFAASDGGSY